jgi:hypothetical protein
MKHLLIVFASTMLCIMSNASAQTLLKKEIFPLSVGNSWKYSYFFTNSNIGNMDGTRQIDSGVVQYVVIDSSSSGDTISWRIQKKSSIIRRLQDIMAFTVVHESKVEVVDSMFFNLNEQLSGYHLLLNTGQKSFSTVWPFYTSECGNDTVYRYQLVDTSLKTCSIVMTLCDPPGPFSMTYTIAFHTDSGLTSCIASGRLGYLSHSYASLSCKLIEKVTILTSVRVKEHLTPSSSLALIQNYPNPFNPWTRISFSIPQNDNVYITISNILGQEVAVTANGAFSAGQHEAMWDARNNASGLYFCRLQTKIGIKTINMLLLK